MAMAIMKHENGGVYNELVKRGIITQEGIAFLNVEQPETETPELGITATTFDAGKSALYEQVLKSDAKTLNRMGYDTPEKRKAVMDEAVMWASSGAQTKKDTNSAVLDRIDKFSSNPVVKEFKSSKTSVQKMIDSAEQNSASGHIALIFSYMKLLDPTSTVREGEFATAQNAGGIPETVRNVFNKAMSGTRLQPGQRQDFLKTAINNYKAQLAGYNEEAENLRTVAETLGIPTEALPKPETFVRKYKDGTKMEYDGKGNYRYFDKNKWSEWTPEGTPLTKKEKGTDTLGIR